MTNREAFKSFVFVVPEPIVAGQKDVKLRWDFKELTKDRIEHLHPGCGCTAHIEVDDFGITAIYADNTKREEVEKENSKIYRVQKHITVYLNDGVDLKLMGPKGEHFNPKKSQVKIFFNASVI